MMLTSVAAGWLTVLLVSPAPQRSTVVPAPQTPARDTSAAQAKGTASIKGKVVTAQGGRPMRRVQMSLSTPELTESRTVSTKSQAV